MPNCFPEGFPEVLEDRDDSEDCNCGDCEDRQNHGLRMKPFFIEIPNFWAWADNLGR
jgi:hypothetical protein